MMLSIRYDYKSQQNILVSDILVVDIPTTIHDNMLDFSFIGDHAVGLVDVLRVVEFRSCM